MDSPIFQQELVSSDRIIYTPSDFAKNSLVYLQEAGRLKAQKPHTNKRSGLDSFLFFIVTSGSGELIYDGTSFRIEPGSCVFIDCKRPYSHRTSDDLWQLEWVHFNSITMQNIYDKYISRGGDHVFPAYDTAEYTDIIDDILRIAGSDDYIRDMRINEKLCSLLTIIMSGSWNPDKKNQIKKRDEIIIVKGWIDEHYMEKISLEELSKQFFIDKFYLSRIFKEHYGTTLSNYISNKRITQAKQMLRFSGYNIETIAEKVGISDPNYFTRLFKKIEGITPGEYRKTW